MAKMNYREASKNINFSRDTELGFSLEQINCGSMQRIADATELMATNFLKLQEDNEWLRRENVRKGKDIERLTRSRNSYLGKYNGLKKKQNGG